MDAIHHVADEGAHHVRGERARTPRAQPADRPLRLVDHVPGLDDGRAPEALEEGCYDAVDEPAAPLRIAHGAGPAVHPHAAQDARPAEPQEVHEHEPDAKARCIQELDGGVGVVEEAAVQADGRTRLVLDETRPPVADREPPHDRDFGVAKAREDGPQLPPALGPGRPSARLPGVGPEVEAIVQPGKVDAGLESHRRLRSARISWMRASATSGASWQDPAPAWPPPPNIERSTPTLARLERLRMERPMLTITASRRGFQWIRIDRFDSGKSV